jgi:voltage-gated potassium channel
MYFLERGAQPDKFGSVPAAAWWALTTLTTVGYGDVVPITPFGKLLGGVVMLLGVGMIALPVAIVATGFSQESSRHQFVVTWSMVARVPLFAAMDESEVAEITKLLYTRTYLPAFPWSTPETPATPCFSSRAGRRLLISVRARMRS